MLVGTSLIVGICSTKVVFACVTVNHTIPINKHLFQNGRALLKCRIFLPPTSGNPDVEKSRSHAPRYDTYVPIVNRHFKRVIIFFVPVFCVPVSCFLCCCRVPLQPQFRHFAVNCSSFSYVYRKNSTGFDVFNITVRFVSCLLCCCRVPLQPQFRQFCSDLLLIFVVFAEIRQISSVVSAVLLLSSTPATVTFESKNLRRLVLFSLCCCRVSLQPQVRGFADRVDSSLVFRVPFQLLPPPSPTPGHISIFF
jgi:hypothetical protein